MNTEAMGRVAASRHQQRPGFSGDRGRVGGIEKGSQKPLARDKSTYCFRSSGSCCWRSRWRSAAGFQTVPPPWVRCNRRSQSRRLSGTGMEASQRWNARQWSARRPGTWSGQRHEQSTADPPALGSAELNAQQPPTLHQHPGIDTGSRCTYYSPTRSLLPRGLGWPRATTACGQQGAEDVCGAVSEFSDVTAR